jgi:hypothetical protein
MNNTLKRLISLRENLDRYKATDQIPWPMAHTYTVLLEEAKTDHSNDTLIASLPDLHEESGLTMSNPGGQFIDCGTVRTWVGQLISAYTA